MPETQRRPTLRSYTSGNAHFWFGVVLGLFVIIVGAIVGGYQANLEDRIATLDGQLQITEDTRDKDKEKALLDVERQSRIMRELLASKLYWTQAFSAVEGMMQAGVRLTSLEGSAADALISFQATANTYADVARQIKAFSDGTGVTDLTVSKITTSQQGGAEFSGELRIDTSELLNRK